MIIVVFEWAKGAQIDFMSFKWMLDDQIVKAHGRIFAQIHNSSRLFSQ
jgi:Ser/Thr protein kinase RdoA (MazF antagonist)